MIDAELDADDGACCTRMTLYTSAWSREYAPPSPADHAIVAVCERVDGADTEPVLVPTLPLVAELIATLTPPLVTIKSAAGEDIQDLRRIVEMATVRGAVH